MRTGQECARTHGYRYCAPMSLFWILFIVYFQFCLCMLSHFCLMARFDGFVFFSIITLIYGAFFAAFDFMIGTEYIMMITFHLPWKRKQKQRLIVAKIIIINRNKINDKLIRMPGREGKREYPTQSQTHLLSNQEPNHIDHKTAFEPLSAVIGLALSTTFSV